MSSSADLPLVSTPEGLTASWVTAALSPTAGSGEAHVTSAELTALGTGQMSDSFRLGLTWDEPGCGPATVVAKLPSSDPSSRAAGLNLRSYEKEVRFYQQLAPELPVRTPRCHHADIDVATGDFVLLLEDMAPATQGDQLTGCSLEATRSALGGLVGLHAPRWGDPALEQLDWLHTDTAEGRSMMAMMMPMLWSGFTERYAADLEPHVLVAGGELFGRMEAYLSGASAPRTPVHGDYRLDNLLFDPESASVPPAVVDWQTVALGTALSDVAYFVGAGLADPALRRDAEEELVRGYHRDLLEAGVTGYGWDDCWRDYRRGTWAGLVVTVGASMLVERTERGDRMFMAMASRHARHALDLDAPALLGTD